MTAKEIEFAKQYSIKRTHPDYESFRKSIFRLKLDGTHDSILRMAYMMGYAQGHNLKSDTYSAEELDESFDGFKKWLDDQCKG